MNQLKWLLLKRCKHISLILLIQVSVLAASAQVKISGKVTGANGTGIPSVSVQIRSTTTGGVTNATGDYEINSNLKPGKYELEFSGVGFKTMTQSFTVGSQTTFTINSQLTEDALNMDEVVVTGTSQGTTKRQLGSYVSTVKAEDLAKGATGNVLAALQGKTAGAQIIQNSGDPAGGISVRLRGISSINSSSEPLYIVDGIIVNNSTTRVTNTSGNYDGQNFVGTIGQNRLADINPADIERVEVLNGAAAAAIYGSRANAGVVQIFTKRGSSGAPVVSFTTNFMSSKLRKSVEVNQSPIKFGGPTDGPLAQTQDILTLAWTNTTPVTRYDYNDYIFHTGLGTDNNVSVSGGKDKTKYYVSGSYFFNEGIIKNTDFRRFSFRSNLDQIINDKLSFSLGLNYINSASNEKPDGNSFFSPINSINIIGNFHDLWTRDANGNIQAIGERQRTNPVSVIEDIKQRQETSRILANTSLKWKPFRNFSIDYTLGIDNYSQDGKTFIPPFAYAVNTGFYGGGTTLDPAQNGYASTATSNYFQINNEINGTYNAKINDNLSSTTQIGYSLQYEKSTYSLLQGRGLAPFVETATGASTVLPGADSRGELSVSGAYLQQNFKFKNHLFVTGAVRVDGSSVFGLDERKQVYVKGSGSYVLSGADYWNNLGVSKWWNLFKVRMAYGQSGNLTGIGPYDRFNSYSSIGFLGRTTFLSSSTLANTKVKPERQEELEFGTDLGFLNNRIGLSFNYYIKKVNDLLISRVIAPTTGFSSLLDNFGALENKGFEIVLNLGVVSKKDFSWDVTGIFNHNRNKATKIGQALTLLSTNGGAPVAILEGQPIGVFYGTFFATDASGNQVKNTSGIPVTERGIQSSPLSYSTQRDGSGQPSGTVLRKVIGDPNPDYTASLVNELKYKKLSMRFQFDAVQGVDVFNADFRTRQGVGNGKVAEMEQRGELPRGYVLGIYGIEEWRIDDGSFVKLRELSFSYDFGKVKNVFSNLSVSLSGRNLISFDNYKGYDPEVNAGGQSTVLRGIDFGAVPIPRTFSIGVQAKF
ncbi:MAG: SusC/RagA family TonB-linked outer membrane protein [Chitinophagaceae bacterium]|nr:SusC/RagA family TonB-linked outer membrane protein [Chitinophagaceae bacterium]MBP9104662.1 SusC/RagA family TonB-linked outer membrane protein [Chitinophagaceae bacterium]